MKYSLSLSAVTHLVIVLALTLALGFCQSALLAQDLCGPDNHTNCIPGDANGDGSVGGITDGVYIIQYIFRNGPAPRPWSICSGDANGDCIANIADTVYLIAYIFSSGPVPVLCTEFDENCVDPGDFNPGPWK